MCLTAQRPIILQQLQNSHVAICAFATGFTVNVQTLNASFWDVLVVQCFQAVLKLFDPSLQTFINDVCIYEVFFIFLYMWKWFHQCKDKWTEHLKITDANNKAYHKSLWLLLHYWAPTTWTYSLNGSDAHILPSGKYSDALRSDSFEDDFKAWQTFIPQHAGIGHSPCQKTRKIINSDHRTMSKVCLNTWEQRKKQQQIGPFFSLEICQLSLLVPNI